MLCLVEPTALSMEEKRLLESVDRLNERLKGLWNVYIKHLYSLYLILFVSLNYNFSYALTVQEAFAGKIVKSPRNGNIQTNKV